MVLVIDPAGRDPIESALRSVTHGTVVRDESVLAGKQRWREVEVSFEERGIAWHRLAVIQNRLYWLVAQTRDRAALRDDERAEFFSSFAPEPD